MQNTATRTAPLLLLFFFFAIRISAQTGIITGTVRGADSTFLTGASVLVQGTGRGTTTAADGRYSLTVPAGRYTINTSFVGFAAARQTVTVAAGETVTADFNLLESGLGDEVVVLGSRSVARTRTETAVPVDVIPIAQVVNEVGQVDLNQIITFIAPSFQSARQTISDGTDHVDPGQLRGLGPDQLLVLVNGKRRHQSALVNVNGTVNRGTVGTDMSAIPANAIERIEILRDGASAQYGSDAIAGVINIVLKKRTGLLEANASYGQYITEYEKNYALYTLTGKTDAPYVSARDGKTFQASLSYGIDIRKGYLSITGEYTRRGATNRGGTYTGAVYPNVNGVNRDDSILAAKGLTRDFFDMRIGNSEVKAGGAFYNFAYPLGDNTEIYVFGGYTKKSGEAAGFYRYPSGIPGNARAYAADVFALYPDGFLPLINSDVTDVSTAVGVCSKLGAWNADISNTFGQNKFDFTVNNSANYTQFATGRAQTSFDAGGLKFLQNTVNADLSRRFDIGLNLATGLEFRIDGFGIRGGEEASYTNYDVASGAAAGAQVFPGFVNTIGDTKTRNAKAIYLDLEQDLTDKFLITGAGRFEHYSDFGSTFNYKFSTRYKFSDALSLRASLSTGFRAPSMQQQFYAKTNTLFVTQAGGGTVPVESGTFTNQSLAAQLLGIPELKEERSRNYSVGLTAKPVRGLEITVDAYQINIKNRIVLTNNFTGGTDTVLQRLLREAGASAANFFTNAVDTRSRGIEAVVAYTKTFAGAHRLRTTLAMTFIDNEVKKDDAGNPIIYASPVLVASGQLGSYFNREDQSRIEVATPKNKISLTFNYNYKKFGAMLRFVNFGKVVYLDPTITADTSKFPVNAFTGRKETLDQEFSAKTVTDLSLSYQVTSVLGVTIGANNLFDIYQDRHTHSSNMSLGRFVYSRRVQQMGFNGAYYFARLKLALPTK